MMFWTTLALVALFGALFGSFLNVVIYRIPRGESIVFPASHCPHCGTNLKPWHNVPVLSWLMLRGRCAFCGVPISAQYPLIELLSAAIATALYLKLGLSAAMIGITGVFLTLLALLVIDFYYKMVPDSLNLLALTLAVVSVWSPQMLAENLKNALIFAGGFALLRFYVSYYLFVKIKRMSPNLKQASWVRNYNTIPAVVEAMGEGDIMIGATMGALLGVQLGLAAVFLSALLALPAMLLTRNETDASKQLPFIPFLAMATWIVYIFDTPIARWMEAFYA
ncbi:prepilin peptidase [Sulfurimonas sp. HSL-3221]|uniref:prepilin peptidase n=1 Tax=Sulfurimonadaceae TaxID=2771471 RepID=UPI001E455E9B|nr:A24 family peptidase [Sulfurimonas sp. HSL-3221]UFS63601.1 prepilin peptidase [Sulfurimonas sp. HSL-3221]